MTYIICGLNGDLQSFNALKEKGYHIADDVYTVPYALKKLLSYLDEKGVKLDA